MTINIFANTTTLNSHKIGIETFRMPLTGESLFLGYGITQACITSGDLDPFSHAEHEQSQ